MAPFNEGLRIGDAGIVIYDLQICGQHVLCHGQQLFIVDAQGLDDHEFHIRFLLVVRSFLAPASFSWFYCKSFRRNIQLFSHGTYTGSKTV